MHVLLSNASKMASVLEGLSNASLLSIGKLCDDDCIAVCDIRHLRIFKKGVLIIQDIRNWTDGLWDVNIQQQHEDLNMIIWRDKTKTKLAEYIH